MIEYAHDKVVPVKASNDSKKKQVADMFDNIAFRYDFLNRFLSVGIDISWRKKLINHLKDINPKNILDIATGTGDVAILMERMIRPANITGIDISTGMLEIGRKKVAKLRLQNKIKLVKGDSENMHFANDNFDAITVSFGVRNFQNLEAGLSEMYRVLKPGGKLAILEFSRPKHFLIKGFYKLYMNYITPAFGKFFAKNKGAYEYLNDSVKKFPEGADFLKILEKNGFNCTGNKSLTFGICTIYWGLK